MHVPAASSLVDIYPPDAVSSQEPRWDKLLAGFANQYGHKADYVARSPGRVNLIGEHIDYSLYQCIPMAVTADVLLAVAPRQDACKIRIANVDSAKFPTREFDLPSTGEIEIDGKSHEWVNYFKAGLKGAASLLKKKRGESITLKGMDILVDGSVPAGGGLSSSAAFVCASALAVMKANGEHAVDKTELTELAIVSERAVGVNSGGMDQAASVFSLRDSALLVSFKPKLEATNLSLPITTPPLVFVIAQSFVVSNKQETGPIHYNLRVVECTLAALHLHKILNISKPLPEDASPLGISLRGLHDTYFESNSNGSIADNTTSPPEVFQSQLEHLIDLVKSHLTREDGYTREDIASVLNISVSDLDTRYTTKVPVRATRFLLRQRALHVFSEALRVQQFRHLLTTSASASPSEKDSLPSQLAHLINATQSSCRDLYTCSTPELDSLCSIARSAGSLGGRVTGAGWGGCSVHLVPGDKVDAVRQAWTQKYYNVKFPHLSESELQEAVVVSRPGGGSCLFEVS